MKGAAVHGFVLCGGKSERMGRDKALIPFLGRPLAVLQVEKLATVCHRVSLVAKPGESRPELSEVEILFDRNPERAALSGVARALEAASSEWILVLAIDLPLVSPVFLAALAGLALDRGGGPIAPTDQGWVQPLCSVWPRSALRAVTPFMARGSFSVLGALVEAGGRILGDEETASLPGHFAGALANVNDPEGLAKAEAVARERGWPLT